jgi:hypothetical protein
VAQPAAVVRLLHYGSGQRGRWAWWGRCGRRGGPVCQVCVWWRGGGGGWWRNQLLWYALFVTAVVSVAGGRVCRYGSCATGCAWCGQYACSPEPQQAMTCGLCGTPVQYDRLTLCVCPAPPTITHTGQHHPTTTYTASHHHTSMPPPHKHPSPSQHLTRPTIAACCSAGNDEVLRR